jgi:hypothetical protein
MESIGRQPYIQGTFKGLIMRAETQAIVDDIRKSLTLLRRHL